MDISKLFNFTNESLRTSGSSKDHIALLRERFRKIDADNSQTLSISELVDDKVGRAKSINDLDVDEHLIYETTKFRVSGMTLGQDEHEITEDEWVHFRMLVTSAPSWIAMDSLNRWVARGLKRNRKVLSIMLKAFASGDDGHGKVPQDKWHSTFAMVSSLQGAHRSDADYDGDGMMDYYEFVSHLFLGNRHEVELAMYDISNGKAPWIPSAFLSGHKFEYIFHTGVRVFGKEFWYGGGVFASEPGKTPFGDPVKVIKLGLTLRTHSELVQYVYDHLRWEYTYASYDVLHHNCNCFSNVVVQFLLNGQQIPEEVRMQPIWAEGGVVMRMIKPMMNRYLGGFGQGSDAFGSSRIDDMTDIWRSRLQEGDIAMWRKRFVDHPEIVRLLRVDHGETQSVDLCLFKQNIANAAFAPSKTHGLLQEEREGVALREIHPVPGLATAPVLSRNRGEPLPPSCSKGHPLQPTRRLGLFKPPACSVCGNAEPNGHMCCTRREAGDPEDPLYCPACKFEMCGVCVAEGRKFQGGLNGGIFTDVLTDNLACELVQKPHWLRFKARSYFSRADQDVTRSLDKEELAHLGDRLCEELGLKPSMDDIDDAFCSANDFEIMQEIDFDAFVPFFKSTLQRAAANVKSPR